MLSLKQRKRNEDTSLLLILKISLLEDTAPKTERQKQRPDLTSCSKNLGYSRFMADYELVESSSFSIFIKFVQFSRSFESHSQMYPLNKTFEIWLTTPLQIHTCFHNLLSFTWLVIIGVKLPIILSILWTHDQRKFTTIPFNLQTFPNFSIKCIAIIRVSKTDRFVRNWLIHPL